MNGRESWRMSWMRLQGQLMRGRKAQGLTQDDLCTKLGVSRSTLQRWELGHGVPNAQEVFHWADELGISIVSTETAESVKTDAFDDVARVAA